MNTERISAPYARALIEMGEAEGTLDDLGEQMALFEACIRAWARFEFFLGTPNLTAEDKMKVIRAAFGDALSKTFLNFVGVVLLHRRGELLKEIAKLFRRELDRMLRRVTAQVRTAHPLDEAQRDRVLSVLKEKLHKNVVIEEKVDPAMLGGVWIRVGDSVLDTERLEAIRGVLEWYKANHSVWFHWLDVA